MLVDPMSFFKQNNNQMRGKYQKINGKSIKYFTP